MTSRRKFAALLLCGAALLGSALALLSCSGGAQSVLDSAALLVARNGSGAIPPWSMFGKNSLRTGRAEVAGPATNKLKWKFDTATPVTSAAVIGTDGTLYFGTDYETKNSTSKLFAVKPDGKLRWSYTIQGTTASPALAPDGTVYFVSMPAPYNGSWRGGNKLYALTSAGVLKWTFDLSLGGPLGRWLGRIGLSPNGDIYVSGNRRLYCISPQGSLQWSYACNGLMLRDPAVGSDGTIYVGVGGSSPDVPSLTAINPDGSLKWEVLTSDSAQGPSIGEGGMIYVGTSRTANEGPTPELYAVSAEGTVLWRTPLPGQASYAAAIAADGTLIVRCSKRVGSDELQYGVYAVNSDGSSKWFYTTGSHGATCGPVVDSVGRVFIGYYFPSAPAQFISIDGGVETWRAQLSASAIDAAAIGADGTAYVGVDGYGSGKNAPGLYAFGPGQG